MFPSDFTDDTIAIFVGPEFAIQTELVHALVAEDTSSKAKAPNISPSLRSRARRTDKPASPSCLTYPMPIK